MPFVIPEKTKQSLTEQGVPEKFHAQIVFDLMKQDIIDRIHKEGCYSKIKTDRWKTGK